MTKKPKGRPPLQAGTVAQRVLLTLDAATIEKGKRIGNGNLSAGVRLAVLRLRLPKS